MFGVKSKQLRAEFGEREYYVVGVALMSIIADLTRNATIIEVVDFGSV